MANAYDFTIDTLDFRCATSKQTPYVRSTAPFRKEQFDSSQAAGDQSLTGWWTRGQLSFHKGDGIKYYEVLDGSAVLNRAGETDRVVVTEPGEVALTWNGVGDAGYDYNFATPADIYPYKPATFAKASGNLESVAIAGGGTGYATDPDTGLVTATLRLVNLYRGGTANLTTTTADMPQSVSSSDSGIVYAAVGNVIEKFDTTKSGWETTPGVVVWTNNNAGTKYDKFVSVWYAKNRLFAVDAAGNWYSMDTKGGTIPTGGGSYLFWSSGITGLDWSLAEATGPIFIAKGRYIYSLTVDSTATPTLSAPTVVGDLGKGSKIIAVAVCRGFLGIQTENSFRLAAIDSGGSLTIGPSAMPYQFMGTGTNTAMYSLAAVGDVFFVVGGHIDGQSPFSVWRVSTTDFIDTLMPVINLQVKKPLEAQGATWDGAAIIGTNASLDPLNGRVYPSFMFIARSATSGYNDSNSQTLSPTGYVRTGFHRFGTLDKKRFYSVIVRAKGTGTIDVWQINPEDTGVADIQLGTLDASTGVGEFLFQYPSGSAIEGGELERLALKFVLNRQSGNHYYGPTFLGYQIKALPSPQRQRLLKVPLVIADRVETRWKRDTGKAGRAWSDLQALEALESSKAIVPFTDHRTGETGSAYIDSIDFQGEVPTDGVNSNFGGVAYATLRVVGA